MAAIRITLLAIVALIGALVVASLGTDERRRPMEILFVVLAVIVVIGVIVAVLSGADIRRYLRMRRM